LTEVFCDFPQSYGSAAIILAGYVITVSLWITFKCIICSSYHWFVGKHW
jgi:hypothetical protein